MSNWLKNVARAAALLTVVAAIIISSCTTVDDTLGLDFIPDDQKMKLRIDTLVNMFDTYQSVADTIPTSYSGAMFLGKYQNVEFGKMVCGALVQFLPEDVKSSSNSNQRDYYFGDNETADSLKLGLYISNYYGETETEQTFYIYGLHTAPDWDKTYYTDFPVKDYYNLKDSLFSFTLEGPAAGVLLKELTPTALGEQYMQSLVTVDTTVYDQADTKFHENFKGFYIAPAEDSPEDAAIYSIVLADYTNSFFSYFTLYSSGDYPGTNKADTTVRQTSFYFDDNESLDEPNLSVITIDRDYTGTAINPSKFADTMKTDPTVPVMYVEGMLGSAGFMRVPDRLLESLEAFKTVDGEKWSDMIINQARVYIPIQTYNAPYMDEALRRLGMYYSYAGTFPTNIPDYAYISEITYGSALGYGGYLNRTNGYYEMDITVYMKTLIQNPETTRRVIWVAPDFRELMAVRHVALSGTDNPDPIKLSLTYTLIK